MEYWASFFRGSFLTIFSLIIGIIIVLFVLKYYKVGIEALEESWKFSLLCGIFSGITAFLMGKLGIHGLKEIYQKTQEKLSINTIDVIYSRNKHSWLFLIQLLGDIIALISCTYGGFTNTNTLSATTLGALTGLIGDIIYDYKMSFFDIISAFYIGFDIEVLLGL